MARTPLQWSFLLDSAAPRALGSFLKHTITDWLPVASARRELALPTVLVVLTTPNRNARVLPCALSEAARLEPHVDVFETPPHDAVWCVALLPGARGRWWIQHEVAPSRGLNISLVRALGGEGAHDGAVDVRDDQAGAPRAATLRELRRLLRKP